ncbi:MAG TPA: esterase-like activity of phytase family protein, partial [Candidatus Binatia bacterium]|nr:esterase-like activity of phytase family protein [Candidatus Binatia bacterium]
MSRKRNCGRARLILLLAGALSSFFPFVRSTNAQPFSNELSVSLSPIEVDPKRPARSNFGALTLLSAFHLQSRDKRFGGLSGLSVGKDGMLYAVSDRGYWLAARMTIDESGALTNLSDWQIAPLLTPAKTAVTDRLRDAEALAQARDGSLLVGFEGVHRIWRYGAPPETFASTPVSIPLPAAVARAPTNGGIEGLTMLPDGRLLALTEQFENPDGSLKGWLLDQDRWTELSYRPDAGFRVTDCAALANGDVLVLERRYMPLGILSARVTRVDGTSIAPGAKLAGKELLKLEQPLAAENFEGIAVRQTSLGAMIFLVSDDNFSAFQQTLLLQFLL